MGVEIIRGAIGSGKSSYILESIEKKMKNQDRKNIIIVPEQFSYTVEKDVVERFGGAGLNGVEVITLSRMVSRFLEKRRDNYLTSAGKMMLVYEAVAHLPKDSLFYGCAKKSGFVDSTAKIIAEFIQYMITPEILRKKAESVNNKLLSEKMYAIADIMDEYLRLIDGRFYDSEEDIASLAEFAEQTHCFSGCDFWFDEFSVFLPQHYRIMKAFLREGADVHVSVCVDSENRELYDVNRSILKRLEDMAESEGVEYSEYKTDDVCRSIKSDEMRFLLQKIDQWTKPGFEAWEKPTNDISVFVCKDLYKEVRHTAIEIRKLIMDEGYRYRDIAVVCGNAENYSHILEAVFNDFSIPYFADTGIQAAEHPVATLVLSVFDILVESWNYASVFRYLRTGYLFVKNEEDEVVSLDSDGIDLLENYVLKYGIRGKNVWLNDEKWIKSQRGVFESVLGENKRNAFTPEEIEKINETRKEIIRPFIKLYERMTGRKAVKEFGESLFEFLKDIYLFEGLNKKSECFDEEGKRNESEQFRMVWNIIMETLNQAVVVMGEEKCTREEFSDILKAGLSAADISIIPSGLDRVAVSSVERSRQHDAKVMFIMGAVFGEIPKETVANGILTDNDRIILKEELAKDGMDIAADSVKRNDMDRFNFFSTLFGVSDKVFISYPAGDNEGQVQRPASILSEFYKVFPELTTGDDIIKEKEEDFLYSPRTAYQYMLTNYKSGGLSGDIYNWYKENEPQKLDVIKRAAEYKKNDAEISPEKVEKLYDNNRNYSASRLSEYGRCPFGYFVKYGLKAREQEIWQIQKFDLGSIMHMAVQMYCEKVDGGAESYEELRGNWLGLNDEESDKIVEEVMHEIEDKILTGITRDENKIRYIVMRMTKIVGRTVKLVRKSLSKGEYVAVSYEKKFRVEVKWKDSSVLINGTVDRIDMAELKEEKIAELRIVDYKTGRKEFSVVSICNRQDMQLVMYAIAAVEMYKNGQIRYAKDDYSPCMRAIVYNNMRDDLVEAKNENVDFEKIKAEQSRPDGLVLLDMQDDGNYDLSSVFRMDSNMGGDSDVVKLKVNKNGTVKKGSKCASTDAFETLMEYVKKSVIEIDREIYDGVIRICPACEGDSSACEWCAFAEVCLYNPRFDNSKNGVTKEEEAWEVINEEVKGDE